LCELAQVADPHWHRANQKKIFATRVKFVWGNDKN